MLHQWYDNAITPEKEFNQGDVVENCQVVHLDSDKYLKMLKNAVGNDFDTFTINGIVISQTCDIVQNKLELLLLCPIYPLMAFIKNQKEPKNYSTEQLRQGNFPAFHLLNTIDNGRLTKDYYVVDFREVYSIPFSVLKVVTEKYNRTRLLSPYREHLSQRFAAYFMRVGLPSTISQDALNARKREILANINDFR